jgi:hypothetical protein
MPMIYVKPRAGGRVRMPERHSRVMPEEGAFVPRIDYYERLLICGDVAICEPPSLPAPAPAKKETVAKEQSQGGPT